MDTETQFTSNERHNQSIAALGYLEGTLRAIAKGGEAMDGGRATGYARFHLEKAAELFPAAGIVNGVDW